MADRLEFDPPSPLPFDVACRRVGIILDHRRCAVDLWSPQVAVEVAVWRILVELAHECARLARAAAHAARRVHKRIQRR